MGRLKTAAILALAILNIINIVTMISWMTEPQDTVIHFSLEKMQHTTRSKINNSIVRLYVGNQFICTGTVIADNYVLTAAHCVTEDIRINVVSDDGLFNIQGWVAVEIHHKDVALIYADVSMFKSMNVSWDSFNKDSVFTTCGYPGGQNKLYCNEFIFDRNRYFKYLGRCLLHRGMSGGPVFDENKNIVGVNSAVSFSGCLIGPVIGVKEGLGI